MTSLCKNAAESLDQNDKLCELSRQEESDHIGKAQVAEETDESNNSGEFSNNRSDASNDTRSRNLIENLTRLIDKLSKKTQTTTSTHQPMSIEIIERIDVDMVVG